MVCCHQYVATTSLISLRDATSVYELGIETNLGLNSSGAYGFDSVTLGWQGSGGPSYGHTVVATLAAETYYVGMFGVKPIPTNFTGYNDPQQSFMQYLRNSSQIAGQNYGYTAGNQYRLNKVFGSLVLGGYDSARLDMSQALSQTMGSDQSRDLVVVVQSIETNASTTKLSGSSFYAFIDSTVPHLWLPISVCKAFEQAFGLKYDSATSLYLVDATLHTKLKQQNPSVTFTLGAQTDGGPTTKIELPYSAFDLNVSYPILATEGQTSYYFPLKQAKDDSQYTLGRTFLQEAYLIVDYDRFNFTVAPCSWYPGSSQLITVQAPTKAEKNDKSKSTPMIIGVSVGVVALILAAGALFIAWKKKWWRGRHSHQRDDNSSLHDLHKPGMLPDMPTPTSVREINPALQNQWGLPQIPHQAPMGMAQLPQHRSELSPENTISELETPNSAAYNQYHQGPYQNRNTFRGELEGSPSSGAISSLPGAGGPYGRASVLPRDGRYASAYPASIAPRQSELPVPSNTQHPLPRVPTGVYEMPAETFGGQSHRGTIAELPTVRQSRF